MKKAKARGKKPVQPRAARKPAGPTRRPRRRATPEQVHDAGHPGGLPDLDAKTDWEAQHDTWWRRE